MEHLSLIQAKESLNLRLEDIQEQLRTEISEWIISEIKRLKGVFPESHFAFAFEVDTDMFVVQVNDLTTYHDMEFRKERASILLAFKKKFAGEVLLFTNPTEGFPLENPTFKI